MSVLQDFAEKVQSITDDCKRFCYATRARQYQVEAAQQLDVLRDEASTLKDNAIASASADLANGFLSFECLTASLRSELLMWVAFEGRSGGQGLGPFD